MTSPLSTTRERALPQDGEMIVYSTKGGVPQPQDSRQEVDDGELESEGHPRVRTSHENT